MKGIIERKTKRIYKTYLTEDYDKIWKDFIFLIEPFEMDTEPFYYLEKTKDGYKIEGESYVFTGLNRHEESKKHTQETRLRLKDKEIKFIKIDSEGGLI